MKLHNILISIVLVSIFFSGCETVENEMPDVQFSAGSLLYKANETTFYKADADSLYKCSPSGIESFTYTLDGSTLTSAELTVELFSSEDDILFSSQDDILYCYSGERIYYKFEGIADGIVLYAGDSTKSAIHRYADFPYATGEIINMDTETNTGETSYRYKSVDVCTATMVARNYWETEAEAKEQNEEFTIIVLDEEEYSYLE